jgi:hypothetical protein
LAAPRESSFGDEGVEDRKARDTIQACCSADVGVGDRYIGGETFDHVGELGRREREARGRSKRACECVGRAAALAMLAEESAIERVNATSPNDSKLLPCQELMV